MTYRLVRILINRLPADSATKTAMRNNAPDEAVAQAKQANETFGPWSQTDMLLAAIVDRLAWVEYGLYRSQGAKGGRKPEPYPRPGVTKKKDRTKPEGASLELLRRLRERR